MKYPFNVGENRVFGYMNVSDWTRLKKDSCSPSWPFKTFTSDFAISVRKSWWYAVVRKFSHTGSCVEILSVHGNANVTLSTNPWMTYWQPRMVALNVSNNRDTSNKQNRQSLHFVVRSGLAGGIAGCVVSPTRFTLQREIPTGTLNHIRQRLWLHHLIEWKYFFRHPIQIFKNTQACTQLSRRLHWPMDLPTLGSWSGAYNAGRDIYKSGGMRGLLQGHSATLLRVFPYAAIKFMAYDQVHYVSHS